MIAMCGESGRSGASIAGSERTPATSWLLTKAPISVIAQDDSSRTASPGGKPRSASGFCS